MTVLPYANMLINEGNMSLEAISVMCTGVEIRFLMTLWPVFIFKITLSAEAENNVPLACLSFSSPPRAIRS